MGRHVAVFHFGHLECLQSSAIGTAQPFRIVERHVCRSPFGLKGLEQRSGRHAGTAISTVQRPTGQPLAHFLFPSGMDIKRIPPVCADRHAGVRHRRHQPALAVAEPRPAGTVQAGKLHVIKRQLLLPVLPPAVCQQAEQPFVSFQVVGIRLPLVPDTSPQRKLPERSNACLVKVTGLIGMALFLVGRPDDVLGPPAPYPVLHEIVLPSYSQHAPSSKVISRTGAVSLDSSLF